MRTAAAVALAALTLLAAPAAHADSPLLAGAELQVQVRIDASRLEERDLTASAGLDVEKVLYGCTATGGGIEKDRTWFKFRDTSSERACKEVVARVEVPPGATGVSVSFAAERQVDPADMPMVSLPVNVTQELVILDQSGNVLSSLLYVDPRAPSLNGTVVRRHAPWPDANAPHRVDVVWAFADRSRDPNLPQNSAIEQSFYATVTDPEVTFTGIPLEPLAVEETRGAETSGFSRTSLTATFRIEPHEAGRAGIAVSVTDHLSLERIIGPEGAEVPARSITTDTVLRTRIVTVDPDAVATAGYGEYTFLFSSVTPLEPHAAMLPLVLGMVVMPGVMAGLSIRQWVLLRRQAGSSYPHVAQQYLWAILVAQAVYLIVLAWLLATQPFPLIVAWPIESQTLLLLGVLLACTAAFFGLAFLAKGRLVRLAEADLAAKRRANLELQRSNRDLEQFAYVASHDLQEPLRAVAGYTQLLQHRYGTRLDDQAQEYIRHAVEGADRMLGLIHGLLAYARIGTEASHAAPVDLATALGEALGNLEVPLRESKGEVTHGVMPVVHADRAQLVQLLQNLVGNALKFRSPSRPPRVHVEARETGTGEWTIEVRDNGIGIPPEHQKRIFQIFQRLHPRDRYPGSGLGLAICQRIVERHGGRIWVESRTGQGSRFLFTIPKAPPAKPPTA